MSYSLVKVPKPVRVAEKDRPRKGLRQKKRMKVVNRKRGGSKFPKRRDYVYQQWVRETAGCILRNRRTWPRGQEGHVCTGPVRCCHVKSRGAGGDDHGNIYGGCDAAHDQQHRLGIKSFEARWNVDLAKSAQQLWNLYQESVGSLAPTHPQEHHNG